MLHVARTTAGKYACEFKMKDEQIIAIFSYNGEHVGTVYNVRVNTLGVIETAAELLDKKTAHKKAVEIINSLKKGKNNIFSEFEKCQ